MRRIGLVIGLFAAGAVYASAGVTGISNCPGTSVANSYAAPVANFGTSIGVCGTVNADATQIQTPPGATSTQLETFLAISPGTFTGNIGSAIKFNFNGGAGGGTLHLTYADTFCSPDCSFYVLSGNVVFLSNTDEDSVSKDIPVPANYLGVLAFGIVSPVSLDPTLTVHSLTYSPSGVTTPGVPEPGTWVLVCAGFAALVLFRRRRATSAV